MTNQTINKKMSSINWKKMYQKTFAEKKVLKKENQKLKEEIEKLKEEIHKLKEPNGLELAMREEWGKYETVLREN